ncbi:MAG TPA: nicotinate phosphoribosyltransferase [Longimicrobiales bacterium]|nr:nicotinate phosphoribosyltransferase [Longimicrobiales bacterium]
MHTGGQSALLTDLYQLTMAQAYVHERMAGEAVFTLSVRRLPASRSYLLACGLDDVLEFLENVTFSEDELAYLAGLPHFFPWFIEYLRTFRFTGHVHAVPEGTPVFADEPILEITASLPEAQLVETFVLNQMHVQTMLASKAARVVAAAAGRAVVDFGLRRMHGTDAGLKAARAFHIAGVTATSNVRAGQLYGIPVSGTMAHSYIQAHSSELNAFRRFVHLYPGSTLLVDTYGTMAGVENVVRLAQELGDEFSVSAIRLDSGDLDSLSRSARARLDESGLADVRIFASGGLEEHSVRALVQAGAPIDGYGVGTAMGVSNDAPSLDMVYKLAEYDGRGRVKTSPGKPVLPGSKQVFRMERDGIAREDVIARRNEDLEGRPLLHCVMKAGARTEAGRESTGDARARAARETASLPVWLRSIEVPPHPYVVRVSDALTKYHANVKEQSSDDL